MTAFYKQKGMMMTKEDVVVLVDAVAMGAAFFYILFDSFKLLPSRRFVHYLLGFISGSSAICYYMIYDRILMIRSRDDHILRGAEYLDWIVTVPTMLVVVGIMGRFPFSSIFVLCCLDIFMNICGLLGAYTCGYSRWIYFAMGCFFFLPQWIFFLNDFDYALVKKYFGEEVARKYFFTGRCLFLSRMVFPVIWVLEVTQAVSYFTALVMFSVMALIAKIGLCFWALACLHDSTYPENDDFSSEASIETEDENALSVIRSSKTNSKQSSPRSDKKDKDLIMR